MAFEQTEEEKTYHRFPGTTVGLLLRLIEHINMLESRIEELEGTRATPKPASRPTRGDIAMS